MKMNMSGLLKYGKVIFKQKSPEILTGLGIVGMVATTVLAVKATPKALQLIEDERRDQNRAELEKSKKMGREVTPYIETLPKKEAIRVSWKCYIPAAIAGVASMGCLIGANTIHARRGAALAAAYTLSETALREFKEAAVETVGEEQAKIISEKADTKRLEKVEKAADKEVIVVGPNEVLCYDSLSGREFSSTRAKIEDARNGLNHILNKDMIASLNDFYDELDNPNLGHNDVGDMLGWNINDGLVNIFFTSRVSPSGIPCLVVNYSTPPKYEFGRFA